MAVSIGRTFGDAIISTLNWAWPRIEPRFHDIIDRVGESLRPDPPMTIVTLSGETVTGILVADRGQVLLFIGTREAAHSGVAPSPRHPFGEDGELWPGDPYRHRR